MKLAPCLIEQWPINMLDGGRLQIEQRDRCLHRLIDAREKNQAQAFLARQRRNFKLSRKNRRQRPLATGENFIQIFGARRKRSSPYPGQRLIIPGGQRSAISEVCRRSSCSICSRSASRAPCCAPIFSIRPSARTISVASTWSAVVT